MPQRKRPADKQYHISLRLTPKLRKKCLAAAEARGMLLSQFLRHAAALMADVPANWRPDTKPEAQVSLADRRVSPQFGGR